MSVVTTRTEQVLRFEASVVKLRNDEYQFPPPPSSRLRTWKSLCSPHTGIHAKLYTDSDTGGVRCLLLGVASKTEVTFSIRISGSNGYSFSTPSATVTADYGLFGDDVVHPDTLLWRDVNYIADRQDMITVEVAVSIPSTTDEHSPVKLPICRLADASFTDMHIVCGDSSVACNKFVVCRESKVVNKAFLDPTTKESKTGIFTIGHDCATVENVHFLVKFMYEGWEREMDDHAKELLVLGDCYECDRIVDAASESLKRRLTVKTFWPTTTIAVLLAESQPRLLVACAKFADEMPSRLFSLFNFPDKRSHETNSMLMTAVAAIHK